MSDSTAPSLQHVRFGCQGTRSPTLSAAFAAILTVETIVVHLWLASSYILAAWVLTAVSVLTLVTLAGDYHALRRAFVQVTPDMFELGIGWRATAMIPRSSITKVAHASWRDIPEAGQDGYVNLANPAEPNILMWCEPTAELLHFAAIRRPARLIGIRVDDPDALVLLMQEPRDA